MAYTETWSGKINRKLIKKLHIIDVAAGREKADLVLKNATYVNVFSGELDKCDIAVAEGLIVGMGSYQGHEEVDMTGKIVLPGFYRPPKRRLRLPKAITISSNSSGVKSGHRESVNASSL